jgi:hypothetical protein
MSLQGFSKTQQILCCHLDDTAVCALISAVRKNAMDMSSGNTRNSTFSPSAFFYTL